MIDLSVHCISLRPHISDKEGGSFETRCRYSHFGQHLYSPQLGPLLPRTARMQCPKGKRKRGYGNYYTKFGMISCTFFAGNDPLYVWDNIQIIQLHMTWPQVDNSGDIKTREKLALIYQLWIVTLTVLVRPLCPLLNWKTTLLARITCRADAHHISSA